MAKPHRQLLTPRWRTVLCVLLILGAAWFSFRFFDANSPHRTAKRYFRDSFSAGVINERMFEEVERMGAPVAVEALASLIDEQNSRWADWYEAFYNRVPAKFRSRLRPPLDRVRVATRSIEMLGRYGREAAPAVPALVRTYQRSKFKRDLVSPSATALGRIGPPASNAIPALLPDLNPFQGGFAYLIAGVLVRIDPTGDQIDHELHRLMHEPRHERLVAEAAHENVTLLEIFEDGGGLPGRDRWSVAQSLGLLRPEAASVVPHLIPLLDEEEVRMRSIAAESLGRLGPAASNALPKLRLLLNDEWAMVREAATNAIRGIDRRLPQ